MLHALATSYDLPVLDLWIHLYIRFMLETLNSVLHSELSAPLGQPFLLMASFSLASAFSVIWETRPLLQCLGRIAPSLCMLDAVIAGTTDPKDQISAHFQFYCWIKGSWVWFSHPGVHMYVCRCNCASFRVTLPRLQLVELSCSSEHTIKIWPPIAYSMPKKTLQWLWQWFKST